MSARPADRGDHGAAGREAVIDQDAGRAGHRDGRVTLVQLGLEGSGLLRRSEDGCGDLVVRKPVVCPDICNRTLSNRTDAVLGLEWMPDLPDCEGIERSVQHCRDLGCDLDATAREAYDDHVVGRLTDHPPAYELQGEEPSGPAPVAKAG
jgi:hypothetical protein